MTVRTINIGSAILPVPTNTLNRIATSHNLVSGAQLRVLQTVNVHDSSLILSHRDLSFVIKETWRISNKSVIVDQLLVGTCWVTTNSSVEYVGYIDFSIRGPAKFVVLGVNEHAGECVMLVSHNTITEVTIETDISDMYSVPYTKFVIDLPTRSLKAAQ